MNNSKVRLEWLHENQVARLLLAAPKPNILDAGMMSALRLALAEAGAQPDLKAIVLAGEGPHFSFGASVEEHLPDQVAGMFALFSDLLRELAEAPAPTIAAVRGQCLGGALELVLACDLILAEETAQLGLPEIKLGVFPPAGSALLPVRIGAGRASEMVLTGASWTAATALAAGLVNRVAAPGQLESELDARLQNDFLPRSASALRYAAQAARRPLVHALRHHLPELESLYLNDLMRHPDAAEGIRAFIEKRPPQWARAVKTAS